jgi:hypothetical protein
MNYTIKRLDQCIICSAKTQYARNTHIDNRKRYVEGVGQLCVECYDDINTKNNLF